MTTFFWVRSSYTRPETTIHPSYHCELHYQNRLQPSVITAIPYEWKKSCSVEFYKEWHILLVKNGALEQDVDDHTGMKAHSLTIMTSIDVCIKTLKDDPQLKEEVITLWASCPPHWWSYLTTFCSSRNFSPWVSVHSFTSDSLGSFIWSSSKLDRIRNCLNGPFKVAIDCIYFINLNIIFILLHI